MTRDRRVQQKKAQIATGNYTDFFRRSVYCTIYFENFWILRKLLRSFHINFEILKVFLDLATLHQCSRSCLV